MHARPRRLRIRGQEGQTAAEYVGMLFVLVAVVAALLLGAPGVGATIAEGIRTAICRMAGGDCATAEGEEFACRLSRETGGVNAGVTAFSGTLGGELAYQLDEMSDGSYEVTLTARGNLGAELLAGGKLNIDGAGVREGRSGSISLTGEGEYSPTYEFGSREEAEAFVDEARDLVAGPLDDAWDWKTLIPIYGPARIPINQLSRVSDFDPPDAVRTRVQGGLVLDAQGDLYGGGGGLSGALSAGTALGADFHANGDTTVYVQLDRSLAIEAGLGVPVGPPGSQAELDASGALDGEVVVALTLDEAGTPTTLAVGTTIDAGFSLPTAGFEGLWFADGASNLDDLLGQASGQAQLDRSDEDVYTLEATASLDLTDPANQQAAAAFFDALGSGDLGRVGDTGGDLVDRLAGHTDVNVALYDGERSSNGVEVKGGKGLAFGFSGGTTQTEQQLVDAWRRPPGAAGFSGGCG